MLGVLGIEVTNRLDHQDNGHAVADTQGQDDGVLDVAQDLALGNQLTTGGKTKVCPSLYIIHLVYNAELEVSRISSLVTLIPPAVT